MSGLRIVKEAFQNLNEKTQKCGTSPSENNVEKRNLEIKLFVLKLMFSRQDSENEL